MACLSCDIILCTNSYGMLHRLHDLNDMKHIIKNDILNYIERAGRYTLIKSYP